MGVKGDWDGAWGLHDEDDARRFGVSRDADFSGLGGGVDDMEEIPSGHHDGRVVRNMDLALFREKLIAHFDYKWHQREVIWPSRTGEAAWEPPASMMEYAARLQQTRAQSS
jgi:hypothetical protein